MCNSASLPTALVINFFTRRRDLQTGYVPNVAYLQTTHSTLPPTTTLSALHSKKSGILFVVSDLSYAYMHRQVKKGTTIMCLSFYQALEKQCKFSVCSMVNDVPFVVYCYMCSRSEYILTKGRCGFGDHSVRSASTTKNLVCSCE